jgi:3'-5' exoribonuclease
MALHYIDNLDAKLEMAKDAYAQSTEIAPQIFERVFPLPTHLVRPLSPFNPSLITPEADA